MIRMPPLGQATWGFATVQSRSRIVARRLRWGFLDQHWTCAEIALENSFEVLMEICVARNLQESTKSCMCRFFMEAALTFAGVWDFEMGLRATQMRGEVMEVWNALPGLKLIRFLFQPWQAAIAATPQAAVAVAGLTEAVSIHVNHTSFLLVSTCDICDHVRSMSNNECFTHGECQTSQAVEYLLATRNASASFVQTVEGTFFASHLR